MNRHQMTPRRQPNLTEQVAILRRQALCGCGCGEPLAEHVIDYHHQQERALGGADAADNWIAVIKTPCHDRLTNGTKATTAGSSKHKIARVRRLTEAHKDFRRRVLAVKKRPAAARKRQWGKRMFQQRAKASRP